MSLFFTIFAEITRSAFEARRATAGRHEGAFVRRTNPPAGAHVYPSEYAFYLLRDVQNSDNRPSFRSAKKSSTTSSGAGIC